MRLTHLLPATLVVAGGCFATKADVRLLQDEVRSLRGTVVVADSGRQREATRHADSLATLNAQLQRSRDSLRVLSARVAEFQASTAGALYEMSRQILAMNELLGQSSRRIQELRAAYEERQQAAADSARNAAPGPAQLFVSALDQLRRGSYGTARRGFQELLDRFPSFEDAALAQLYIGEAYAQEQNAAAADSVYQLVVTRYPQAPQAPTALYKRALLLRNANRAAEARTALQRIVRDYPRSDEATLARDLLSSTRR